MCNLPEWTQEDPQLHASSYQRDYYNAQNTSFKNVGAEKKDILLFDWNFELKKEQAVTIKASCRAVLQ